MDDTRYLATQALAEHSVDPQSQEEKELTEIFARILKVQHVDTGDNFFEIGGHSLQATELVVAMRTTFGVDLPLRCIFEAPTVARMARYIAQFKTTDTLIDDSASALSPLVTDPARRHMPFQLNDVQHAYWIGRSAFFELGNVATHVYVEYESVGLNLGRFETAWQRVIERHDMLRAVVLSNGQQQILQDVPPYQIHVLDLKNQEPGEVETKLEAVRQRMSHQMFSTDQWPLFEICATQMDGGRIRLHCSLDLLIADLWSTQIIFQELAQLYNDFATSPLPLTLSFRDYVLAEAALEDSDLYRRGQEYWLNRLEALPRGPELPLVKSPSLVKQPRFVRRTAKIDPERWLRLKARATRAGLTPSGILLAAYAEILAIWSHNPRFTVNVTLFNRLLLHPQVMDIVGDFTSLSLVAVDYSGDGTFEARAQRLQQQLWDDIDHRQFSGVRVMREIVRRGGTKAANFPVVFTSALVHGASASVSFLGEQVYGISQTPQIWLDHQVMEEAGMLVFNWDAVDELFPDGLLQDMFDAYCRLLQRLSDEEASWQGTSQHVLPDWQLAQRTVINATEAAVQQEMLHTLFATQVAQQPNQQAVVSGTVSLTYQELYQQANHIGHRLRDLGARPNELVAVVMEKGWEQIVAVLGILQSGAAYVPIDPTLPKERRFYLLECTQVRAILTQAHLNQTLEWPEGVYRITVSGDEAVGDGAPLAPVQQPEDLAYVIFTSGSSGVPKGVMLDHRAVVNTILDVNERFHVGPTDRVLALSSLSFDLSVYDVFGMLAAGGTIVMPDADGTREPAHWVELLKREWITIWNTVPALMAMLIEYAAGCPEILPPTLRLALLSGDWIPLTLPLRIRELRPEIELIAMGGATEASIWSILHPIGVIDPSWKSVPYGRPMKNQWFQVLNEALEPCPVWVTGHLYIGGVGLARGYWRDEVKTHRSFITHPRSGERLYRTGDLGRYMADGNIEFLGREDFQVKVQGHRIELGEIEANILAYPGVQAAVVNVISEASGAKRLVGYVVPAEQGTAALFEPEYAEPAEYQAVWDTAIAAAEEQAQTRGHMIDSVAWADLSTVLDRLVAATIACTLTKLGSYTRPGENYTLDELMHRVGILPRYQKWLRRSLGMLVFDGILKRVGDGFVSTRTLPSEPLPREWDDLLARASSQGLVLGGLEFARRSAKHLSSALTGQADAVEFLFVDGESNAAKTMYRGEFDYCNNIAQALIKAFVESWPVGRPLRILEIGAGVGSTTHYLLPLLPEDCTTYVYTDISRYFMGVGKENFGDYPFVKYQLLDIEKDPHLQGYERHDFDVVVAASVLHATRNLAQTVQHVRSLMAPGGLLLLLEETKFPRVFTLTMGLQQGFDRFEDEELRKEHPLLSVDQWQDLLMAHGFEGFSSFAKSGTTAELMGLNVLVARAPARVVRFKDSAIRDFLSRKLPAYMLPSTLILLDALPLSSNGKVNCGALPIPWQLEVERIRVFSAPNTLIEKTVAGIWEEVLGVERVSVNDNFFELGGDSLLATRMVTQLRQAFQVELPTRSVFEAPTVVGLAVRIEAAGGTVARAAQEYTGESDLQRVRGER